MKWLLHWLLAGGMVVVATGCDDKPGSPVRPSVTVNPPAFEPPAPPTRIIRLTSDSGAVIDFGDVAVGTEKWSEFSICNDGTGPLTIGQLTGPDGFLQFWDAYRYDWEFGSSLPARACTDGSVVFVPAKAGRHEGAVVVNADHTAGTNTIAVRGNGTAPARAPLNFFGEGSYIVGLIVAPGRYHADPNHECSWYRASKYPPQVETDFIAGDTTWFDPGHWIVDILPTDVEFSSYPGCGYWNWHPGPKPAAGTIPHGVWEVGRHIEAGRYRADDAGATCRWQRLKHFQWTPDGVVAQGETSTAGAVSVTISTRDAGFLTTPECGIWKRTQ